MPLAPNGPPTNLPAARTTFVGRATDLAELKQAMDPTSHSSTRLLILTGVAGCGKTRLALKVAEAVCDAYHDGVWLVELAPLPSSLDPDPSGVVAATLSALGLQEQPGTTPMDTLIAHLQPRRLLLVLDNCEHVVTPAAALAARLLAACLEVQILTTSQIALGTALEAVWQVLPLAVPDTLENLPTEAELTRLRESDVVRRR